MFVQNFIKLSAAVPQLLCKQRKNKKELSENLLKTILSTLPRTIKTNFKPAEYTGWAKKRGTLLLSMSSPIIDQFSKFFHRHTQQTICNTCLLHIPPQHKCVFTLHCEMSMKYALITILTNRHFGKIEKKHFRPTLQWMVCMTLNCVGLIFAYVYISQGSGETHINHAVGNIIITLLQIVRRVCQCKNFENRLIIGEDMDKGKVPRFLWPMV